jgi:PAS domain S-box-containing protein
MIALEGGAERWYSLAQSQSRSIVLTSLLLSVAVPLTVGWFGRSASLAESEQREAARLGATQGAAAALRATEERFLSLVRNASDAMLVLDADGSLRYASPSVSHVLGREPDSLTGASFFGVVHPDDAERVRVFHLRQLANPLVSASVEYRYHKGDGSWRHHAAIFNNLLRDPNVGGIVVNVRDVTEIKRDAELLRQAKEEAERANQAKNEFLSRTSNELRTPLNAILGFAQLLEIEPLDDGQQEMVSYILNGGRHLLGLIDEVLDIARIESGRLALVDEEIPIDEIVAECLDLVAPLARERSIQLTYRRGDAAGCYVVVDRQRLKQVLLNLLSNAVKYNRVDGRVEVVFQRLSPERMRVGVHDTGPGIAADKLERLFTPFDRLGAEQTRVEGSGLGLALSQRLISAMGGAISLDNEPGRGCTFWAELACVERSQRAESEAADLETTVSTADEHAEHGCTVLYIEDNLSNLTLVERILAASPGIQLVPAMQGSLGLELAREYRPDLILLDLNLPDMTGAEVLRRLQTDRATRGRPVVVISADATPASVEGMLAAGARDYLTKPLDVRHFQRMLDQTLQQGAA